MTRNARVAAAAQALVGTPFRLHGRDPASGLDCIGVAALAIEAGGCVVEAPVGYALRSGDVARLIRGIAAAGLVPVADEAPGTLVLAMPGPGQLHLAIRTARGLVHADCALRRVVERPGRAPWPILSRWRIDEGEG